MKLKTLFFITLIALILFINSFGFSQMSKYGTDEKDEIFISSRPLHYAYLVFLSSLTEGNKTTFRNVISVGKDSGQPSGRFFALYNSTETVSRWFDSTSKVFKYDTSTTRMFITVNADSFDTIKAIGAEKAKLIHTLYEKTYRDKKTGRTIIKAEIVRSSDYEALPENKDWNICESATVYTGKTK